MYIDISVHIGTSSMRAAPADVDVRWRWSKGGPTLGSTFPLVISISLWCDTEPQNGPRISIGWSILGCEGGSLCRPGLAQSLCGIVSGLAKSTEHPFT